MKLQEYTKSGVCTETSAEWFYKEILSEYMDEKSQGAYD